MALWQGFDTAHNEGPTVYGNSEAPTAYDAPSGKSGTRNPGRWKARFLATFP
jgi:hypothetical protein